MSAVQLPSSKQVKDFVLAQFLPLGLILVTVIGILIPEPGRWLDNNTPLNTISIVGIFFISGLQLQTAEIRKAAKSWPAYVFATLSILAISPCLSLWISSWDLGPREFADGLALFLAMPTTVSSGVLMTTEAGGNTALAVMLSAGTNLLGVATAPLFLSMFLSAEGGGLGARGAMNPSGNTTNSMNSTGVPGSRNGTVIGPGMQTGGGSGAFNILDLLAKLGLSILLPLALGKFLRKSDKVVELVKTYKLQLKITSTLLLISVPLLAMSTGSALIRAAPPSTIFALIILGILLHFALLVFNYGACHAINSIGRVTGPLPYLGTVAIDLPETKAVVIGASQKTVNTAVAVINFLPPALGDRGLLTLPCVIAHLMQILMDAVLVTKWKKVGVAAAGGAVGDGGKGSSSSSGSGSGTADARVGEKPPPVGSIAYERAQEEAAEREWSAGRSTGLAALDSVSIQGGNR